MTVDEQATASVARRCDISCRYCTQTGGAPNGDMYLLYACRATIDAKAPTDRSVIRGTVRERRRCCGRAW